MCLDWSPRRYLLWYWAMSSAPISTLDLWLRTSERYPSSVLFCSFAVVARIYWSCSFALVVPYTFSYGNVIQELCKLRQWYSRNLWPKGTFLTHLEDLFCYATLIVVSFQVAFLTNLDSHDLLKLFLASGAAVSIVVLLSFWYPQWAVNSVHSIEKKIHDQKSKALTLVKCWTRKYRENG